jgi:hypothetical protein
MQRLRGGNNNQRKAKSWKDGPQRYCYRLKLVIVTPRSLPGRAYYPWQLSRISRLSPQTNTNLSCALRISRLSPQTNTNLSCALCPHSCAPGNKFPVGHPSWNRSRPSTLNLEFFSDELSEKKLHLVDMSILLILLSPRLGCHIWTRSPR